MVKLQMGEKMVTEPDILVVIAELMTGIGAIAAILLGIREYQKGQRWQKAQVLLSLIDSFERNKQIELARRMLDWDEREVFIDGKRSIQFKNDMLITALRVVSMDTKIAFTPEEQIIRDAFDAFFDFFHKLYAFQKSGLLTLTDYTYFFYWFELLRNIGNYKRNPAIQKAIHEYIRGFEGIQYLLKEYSKNPEPLSIMELKEN